MSIALVRNKLFSLVLLVLFLLGIFVIIQFFGLRKAHSTFENYYAFRGCEKLLQRANEYGVCQTKKGNIIRIVLYKHGWYLDGDLPYCIQDLCF